ncbi:hypothetical protein Droror1_Dr00002693 [Drosera rotundifolia]
MAAVMMELRRGGQIDKKSPLMDQSGRPSESEHVIDISRNNDASSSSSTRDGIHNGVDLSMHDDRSSGNMQNPASQRSLPVSISPSSRNSSVSRIGSRGNGPNRRRRSPLNSGFWISVELVLILGQIIAAVVVLCISKDEHRHTKLFSWIIGYAAGCFGTLPLIYWRFLHRNQGLEQDAAPSRQISSVGNSTGGSVSRFTGQSLDSDNGRTIASENRSSSNLSVGIRYPRLKALVECFKMGLDCFFAIWFVVGNVWIFGGHTSSAEAPNLYRLCIVFLVFSCIGYAMPFILCTTICCCLPCIISVLGFREDLNQTRGATSESISALPTYKFKLKKCRNGDGAGAAEFGYVAMGTEKERAISEEDALCCICLAKYVNNDELRELPCSHLFHKECVDKWLKINALCPLCKTNVGDSVLNPLAGLTASLRHA